MNVPELRFPGFNEPWKEIRLGDLAERIGDGLHGTPIYAEDSDMFFINGNNLINGKIEINGNTKKVDYETFKNNNKGLDENTLLVSINGTIGNIAKYKNEKVMLGKSVGYFNFNENTDFYYFIFNTEKVQNFFISELTGSTIKNLSLKTLRNAVISIPSLPEQTCIANFLTTVDEKLTQLKKKKTLLEQYKKGVMQKIFSQKLHFKDKNGKEFPEWEIKTLGEISGNIMYGMNSTAISYDGINKYLRITDIDENTRKFIPNPLTSPDGKIEEKYKLKEGDIVFARTGASVGKSYFYDKKDGNLLFAGFLIKFSITNGHPYFIYTQLLKESYNKWILKMSMRSGQPGINAEEYKSLPLFFPSIPEQTLIANFLSSIDDKIKHCDFQIEKTELWKKGLLQKMFV